MDRAASRPLDESTVGDAFLASFTGPILSDAHQGLPCFAAMCSSGCLQHLVILGLPCFM